MSVTDVCVLKNINEINYCNMDGRPFNFVNLNNKRFNSLFDTGAKISVISKDVLKNMNIKIKDDKYSKKSLMR